VSLPSHTFIQLLTGLTFLVKFLRLDINLTPLFELLRCSTCNTVIRGSMYECIVEECTQKGSKGIFCQDCRYETKHTEPHLVKVYRHCILREAIDPEISRKICHCTTLYHNDSNGHPRELFPVCKSDQHRDAPRGGGLRCGLLTLGDHVAEAKYQGILLKLEKRKNLQDAQRIIEATKTRNQETARRKAERERRKSKPTSRQKSTASVGTFEAQNSDEDIPFFMKDFTDRYPFGNVHMALRFGPLLFENGVMQ
jgi:hypothetical protein